MKTRQKQVTIIVGIWLAVIIFIAMLTRANLGNLSNVEELGNSLEELKSTLYFDTQYRVNHVDSVSLKIQLIYSLRLQLETSYETGYFQPDISQLIFTTDRFIELVKQFNNTEVEVTELVERLNSIRESYEGRPEIQGLYYQLSARVFEAMFSDSTSSPEIYRSLDYLFVQSQSMPSEDGEKLQQALAQTSSVLGAYAKGNYLVEKLLNHPLNILQSDLKSQYDALIQRYYIIAIIVSAFAMFCLSLIIIRKPSFPFESEASEPSQSNSTTTPLKDTQIKESEGRPLEPVMESPAVTDVLVPVSATPEPTPQSFDVPAMPQSESAYQIKSNEPLSSKVGETGIPDSSDTVSVEESSSEVNIDYMLQSLNDDNESVVLLLDVFIQDHETDAQQLPELLKTDAEHAMRKAHSLKGVAANLGAEPLKEIATQVELDIKNDVQVSEQKLQELVVCLSSTIESAKRYIASQK
ncbi:Hpt domain-containing protein [uncultured Vibrio sp.]|uniref:Hpt domain-containing protein n=1 Tax=uncultured Vibrio sp. TaxID=114054 RepID=UPI0025F8058B|nr:Hpt domain-containing protein [uncultured Vibrio sp.]